MVPHEINTFKDHISRNYKSPVPLSILNDKSIKDPSNILKYVFYDYIYNNFNKIFEYAEQTDRNIDSCFQAMQSVFLDGTALQIKSPANFMIKEKLLKFNELSKAKSYISIKTLVILVSQYYENPTQANELKIRYYIAIRSYFQDQNTVKMVRRDSLQYRLYGLTKKEEYDKFLNKADAEFPIIDIKKQKKIFDKAKYYFKDRNIINFFTYQNRETFYSPFLSTIEMIESVTTQKIKSRDSNCTLQIKKELMEKEARENIRLITISVKAEEMLINHPILTELEFCEGKDYDLMLPKTLKLMENELKEKRKSDYKINISKINFVEFYNEKAKEIESSESDF